MANLIDVYEPVGEVKFQYASLAPLALPAIAEDELTFDTAGEAHAPVTTEPALPGKQPESESVREQASQPAQQPSSGQPEAVENGVPLVTEGMLGDFLATDDFEALEAPQRAPSLDPEDAPPSAGQEALPWAKASGRITSPLLRLHNEVVEFCRALAPTADEVTARAAAIARVSEIVQTTWPSAEVQVFGSYVTGLFLPTSDLDLVIINSGCKDVRGGLRALANGLTRKGMAKQMQVIAKAKVPIIKFVEVPSAFNFDISFDVANGPLAAEFVSELMQQMPPMRPLVLVLKIFLQQREFNEVYTGGIGSYALLVMVASFLMLHPSRQEGGTVEGSLGVLLLDFFRLYGRVLNMHAVAISCRKGGRYFCKHDRPDPFLQPDRPHMLAVEDPKDATNDLCKGSYQIVKIRAAFEYAYQQLGAPAKRSESILQRIIRVDKVLLGRPQPAEQDSPSWPASANGKQSIEQPRNDDDDDDQEEHETGRHSKRKRTSEPSSRPSSVAASDEDYMNDKYLDDLAVEEGEMQQKHKKKRHHGGGGSARRRSRHYHKQDSNAEGGVLDESSQHAKISDDKKHRHHHKHHSKRSRASPS